MTHFLVSSSILTNGCAQSKINTDYWLNQNALIYPESTAEYLSGAVIMIHFSGAAANGVVGLIGCFVIFVLGLNLFFLILFIVT